MADDYKRMMLQSRLEAAKDSITRARYVILICILASLALIVADLNGYFSWYRFFVLAPKLHGWDSGIKLPEDVRHHFLITAQDQLIKSWVESLMVSIPPLGLRFGVSDIAVFGPAALCLLMIVLWYVARRENRAIVGLLRETADGEGLTGQERADMRGAVYHSISSHLVFLPVGEYSDPLLGLHSNAEERHSRFVRFGYKLFVYFPLLATLLIGAVEIYSNHVEEKLQLRTFRDNLDEAVSADSVARKAQAAKDDGTRKDLEKLEAYLRTVERVNGVQKLVNNVAPILAALFLLGCSRSIVRYSEATVHTLREYHQLMQRESNAGSAQAMTATSGA